MNVVSVNYHATVDVDFSPTVRHEPAAGCFGEYFVLKLAKSDLNIFATRAQLVEIATAIAKGIIPPMEIPELKPITVQVQHPNIPEWEARS